jgi:hypothetical protein
LGAEAPQPALESQTATKVAEIGLYS